MKRSADPLTPLPGRMGGQREPGVRWFSFLAACHTPVVPGGKQIARSRENDQKTSIGRVAELADARDLKSREDLNPRTGSSPVSAIGKLFLSRGLLILHLVSVRIAGGD